MSERSMSIVFSSEISAITECNSSFDSGVLRVCYTGKNRNNSFISKETFERCMSSIYNCPVVCRYDRDTDTIGSHDMELVSEDGGMRVVNVTHPVGVVPQSAKYWWEEIEDDSGVHEYLCVDVLLWKRQEAYKKIKEDGITDESMEISVKEGKMVDGVYVIDRFEFTAFCLLGTAEPCYESASLEVFSKDNFKEQFAEMMQEFKETFALAQSPEGVCIYQEKYSEGGKEILDEKKALASEYGFDIEKLDFAVDDMTLEELRVKFESMKNSGDNLTGNGSQDENKFALECGFRDELRNEIEAEKVDTVWGKESHYWLWDYDKDASEVYATDTTDWNIYGFTYSMDGDHVVIDFSSKKRMKVSLVPFDEGTRSSPETNIFTRISEKYASNNAEWLEKDRAASDKIASMQNEINVLRRFKTDTENAIEESKREEVFAQFADLAGVEAFEALRENCKEYSPDVLEEKCYAIRGRVSANANFSLEPRKVPKLPVEKSGVVSEPYGGIFAEYGFSRKDAI